MKTRITAFLFAALLSAVVTAQLHAQGTAFTYQGALNENGVPYTGLAEMRFTLFNAVSGGSAVAANNPATASVNVSSGLFTVALNFGAGAFPGAERWLEIQVRTGLGAFSTLTPRQAVTPAPYAMFAPTAGAVTNNSVTAAHVAGGQVVKSLNGLKDAVNLVGGTNVTLTPNGNNLTLSVINPWQASGTNTFYNSGNVGIGTTTPNKRLSVAGDMEVGINSSDYRHLRIGGGNSDGFLYGSFAHFGDGIHIGYNYFADAAGVNRIIRSDGGASRVSMGYGFLALATAPAFGGEPVNRLVVGTTGNVGVGTVAPLAKLDVRGDIRLGPSGQYRATSGEENLRIIRGNVDADGNITQGSGFTVIRSGEGNYLINFNTPFAGIPTVTATGDRSLIGRQSPVLMTDGITASWVRLQFNQYDNWQDRPFHFIAIGPR